VVASKILRERMPEAELRALVADFKHYKETDDLPSTFGRDAPFHRPSAARQAELSHIHLNDGAPWHVRAIQYARTSDTFLVYCPGFTNPDAYALIAIIEPKAHKQSESIDLMNALAEVAEQFRARY